MHDGKTISVVFPAYNEEAGIVSVIEDFRSTGIVDEILVINNNSNDDTAHRALGAGARVVSESSQGYGHALRRGLAEATGDYIVLCEPDGTFRAKDLLKLLAYAPDFIMVCGTRTTPEMIWDTANMGWFLRFGNIVVAKLLEVLYGTPSLSDCGCTFRLIRADAARVLARDLTVGGSHFLPEMVILCVRHNFPFIEIPVVYRGRIGHSKITGTLKGAVKTGLNMIGLMVSYRLGIGSSNGSGSP